MTDLLQSIALALVSIGLLLHILAERRCGMTREEAISVIQEVFDDAELSHCGHYATALDMAIEALQDRPTPCEKCIHVKSCRKVIILKNRTYKLVKYCSQGAERREP